MTATRVCWLLLLSLGLAAAAAALNENEVPGQKDRKLWALDKWKNNLDDFVRKTQSGAGKALNDFWKPKKEFLETGQRYHRWHGAYSRLCKRRMWKQSECLPAHELFLREYSKLDHELLAGRRAEEWKRADKANQVPKHERIENADHLFQLLSRLVDRLEALQESLEGGREPLPKEFDKAAVDESMERLRRIVLQTGQNVLKGEALEVGRLAAFKMLAIMLTALPPAAGSPLGLVAPIILLLGNPQMSMPAHWLLDIQIRTLLNTAYQLNPVPQMFEEISNKLGEKEQSGLQAAGTNSTPEVDVASTLKPPATRR